MGAWGARASRVGAHLSGPARRGNAPPPPIRPQRPNSAGTVFGRLAAIAVVLVVLFVVIAQYRGIVSRNIALANELSSTRAEVSALDARKKRELREITRMQTPAGAIPEIHDKLRMVGPNEEMIYLKGDVPPTAEPSLTDGTGETP